MSSETKNLQMRVTMYDDVIGVRARLESRADVAELMGRLEFVASYLWPANSACDAVVDMRAVGAALAAAEAVASGVCGEGSAATAAACGGKIEAASVRRMIEAGPLSPDDVEGIVAEQLSDDEFEKLSPAMAEAVALRRLGLTAAECGRALGVSEQAIWARSGKAKERGVVVSGISE